MKPSKISLAVCALAIVINVARSDVKLPNVFEKPENLKRFAAGQTIFEAGQAPDFMYVVKMGEVDLYKDGRLLETVGPDGFFGELALFPGR